MCIPSVRLYRLALWASAAIALCSAASAQDASVRKVAALPTTTIDPDIGFEAEQLPTDRGGVVRTDGGAASSGCIGTECTCEPIGAWNVSYSGSLRYRGDLIRIGDENVVLCQVKMELAFSGTSDLYVSIHRLESDETYKRFTNDVILRSAIGNGTPAFYSTQCLNLPLPPGDYIIAFAWSSAAITFAHDGLNYPRPFEGGTVLGSMAFNLANFDPPQPPVDNVLPPLQVFTLGAYSMEFCFVPVPGACCSGGTCEDKLQSQCAGAGSYFHGQRSMCAETSCKWGACCDGCGACISVYTPEACAAAGGIDHWLGAGCPTPSTDLCPRVTGACCTGTSCVDTKCEAECIASGGIYRGDGTDCTPNICQGACCVSGGCLDRTQGGCSGLHGTYKGDGTACATLPVEQQCGGACCSGFTALDFCSVVAYRGLCTFDPNGFPLIAYRGDGTACSSCGSIDGYSACCLPSGACMNTSPTFCTSSWIQGISHPGVQCDSLAPACSGAIRCCFGDGSCDLLTPSTCVTRGGIPKTGQTTCSPVACASDGGACCGLATGACTMTTRALCQAQGGLYQGDNSDCSNPAATCPGFGSCCRSDGACFDKVTGADCAFMAGVYEGSGAVCSVPPLECPQRGACCALSGHCLFVDATSCAEVGGAFHGEGVACADIADACVSGACCKGTTCVPRTAGACVAESGLYQGNYTTCAANACTGACCEPSGQCTEGVQGGACAGAGQVFHLGTLCADVQPPCAVPETGACCNGNTGACADGVALSNCQGANMRFGGAGSSCATLNPPCTAAGGACCVESAGVCTNGVLQANCQAAGQRWGGAGVTCAALNPPCHLCTIVSSDPLNCTIDARQPYPPSTPGSPQGWISLALTFDPGCNVSAVTADDFTVACTPTGPDCPTITTAAAIGQTVTINLSGVIPAQKWTCITHTGTGKQFCLGSLPADVNGDRTAAPVDILELIDNLNGVRPQPLTLNQCDLDRSDLCAPADILTEIDLLNGASGFQTWNGRSLPVCPSGP